MGGVAEGSAGLGNSHEFRYIPTRLRLVTGWRGCGLFVVGGVGVVGGGAVGEVGV